MTTSMTLAETAYVSPAARTSGLAIQKPARGRVMSAFVAAVTALAMITASAVPAHAELKGEDLLKALAAIAAIAIISDVIKDKKDRKHSLSRSPRVPSNCAIEIGSGRGAVIGYSERCLRRHGFTYRLPRGCATDIRIYGRADRFYPARCLRDAGFNIRPR